MSRNLLKQLEDRLDVLPKPVLLKLGLAVLLVILSLVLYFTNRDLMAENQRMLKFIKNEKRIQAEFDGMIDAEDAFAKFVVPLNETNNRDKVKADNISLLMKIIEKNKLKVDSYHSEVEESDGFVIFKYNVTIMGNFIDSLQFFHRLPKEAPHIYVTTYDIGLHLETMTRMALRVEVVGVPL